jgi:hypothetical protein
MGTAERILISIGVDGISIDTPSLKLASPFTPASTGVSDIPLPRAVWAPQGGTYSGLVVPRDGGRPYHLVAALTPEAKLAPTRWGKPEKMDHVFSEWDGFANTAAILEADPENVIANRIRALSVSGHSDWYWPSMLESAVMYANIGDLVRQFLGTWGAWISAQHPDYPSDAYVQYFVYGFQDWDRKGVEFGAVAVRRVYSDL